MIKIKTAFSLLFGLIITFLFIILLAFLLLLQNREEFGKSQFNRHYSLKLSDELRQRNDDLTNYCTNYIITGDSIWEARYTALSNNEINLEDASSNASEIALLLKAELKNDKLNNIELKAMNAAKGLFSDSLGHYTIKDHPKQQLALKTISSKEYRAIKKDVLQPIILFEKRIEEQTNSIYQKNIKEGLQLFHTVLSLLITVLVISGIAFYMIFKRVVKQEKQDVLFRQGVVELQKAQSELLQSDERFKLAVTGSGARAWDYQVSQNQLIWSPPHLPLLDYQPEEIGSDMQFLLTCIHQDDKNKFETLLQKHIETDIPFNIDARFYTKQSDIKWIRCKGSSSRDKAGKATRIVGIFIDITDRVKAEEKATNAILETEDKERSRIAREIHDSLQQTMSTALLNFEKVRSTISFDDELLAQKYQTGYQYLKKAIAESRTLAHNLMPKVVSNDGVIRAVESLIGAIKGSTDIEFTFYTNLGDERIKMAAEMTIYRIIQEAINNVIKYSQAKQCTIQLLKHDDMVTLTIEDDGIGFESDKIKDSFGLNSMKTRADAIGAFLEIESAPGRGTQVLFEINI